VTSAKLEIQNLLPHAPPMRMLSEVLSYSDARIDGLSRIQADNPLLEGGRFPCLGGIELFAQLAGVLFGLRNAQPSVPGSPGPGIDPRPQRGAVVQINSFSLGDARIPVGAELNIHADFVAGTERAAKMSGSVYYGEQRIFEGVLMIALLETQTA